MKTVSFILAFYMFIGSFIPRTDFSQLMLISDLMEHFESHQEGATLLGEAFNFWDFLELHISSPDHHHHDETTDHDNVLCHSFHASVVLYLADIATSYPDIFFSNAIQKVEFQNGFYLTGFIKTLLQPPVLS